MKRYLAIPMDMYYNINKKKDKKECINEKNITIPNGQPFESEAGDCNNALTC